MDLERLPKSARDLAGLIGLDATVTLVQEFGGTRLYVAAERNHRLRELIGERAAELLSRHYGSVELHVPLCPALNEVAAVEMYRAGQSAAAIARRFKRGENWVYAAVRRHEAQRCKASTLDLWEDNA